MNPNNDDKERDIDIPVQCSRSSSTCVAEEHYALLFTLAKHFNFSPKMLKLHIL